MQPKLLFKTGQIDCYDADGTLVDCAGSGQDGELRMGRNWPRPRFEVRPTTVYDRITGLMWTKDASLGHFPLTWKEAIDFIRQMNRDSTFDYSNWKLPSRDDLFALISHVHINPALPAGAPFENVFTGYYWTRTTCSRLEDQAWYVHLGGGRMYRGMKYGSYMVWPVRCHADYYAPPLVDSQQPESEAKFYFKHSGRYVIDNGIFYDRFTGLGWTKLSAISSDPFNWIAALDAVRRMNGTKVYGYVDWRLPNIRELESIIDLNRHTPALSAGHPFGQVSVGYWSSTTSAYEPRYAWVVYMQDGAVGVGYKKYAEFHALAVRSGGIQTNFF